VYILNAVGLNGLEKFVIAERKFLEKIGLLKPTLRAVNLAMLFIREAHGIIGAGEFHDPIHFF
jgi:hypothetical protein